MKKRGPKSRLGLERVSRNALKHGLAAKTPVLPYVESQGEWESYHRGMVQHLSPQGALEQELVDDIALSLWRIRRLTRWEGEQLANAQEDAIPMALAKYRDWISRVMEGEGSNLDHLVSAQRDEESLYKALIELESGSTRSWLFNGEGPYLVYLVLEALNLPLSGLPDVSGLEAWTVGRTRKEIMKHMEIAGLENDLKETYSTLRLACWAKANDISNILSSLKTEVARLRHEALLLEEKDFDRVMRYESHLRRSLNRSIHELQRIQALRVGIKEAVPKAIDVDEMRDPPRAEFVS